MLLGCAAALCAAGCGAGEEAATRGGAPVVWAVGDGGVANDGSRAVVDLISRDRPAHVIYLGDVYQGGSAGDFETFGRVWRPLLERTLPTPGNHDWPQHREGYDPFWAAVDGRRQPYRYKRRVAGWELIAANSEVPGDATQRRWLEQQAAGGGTCRIVFWHRPRFNAGEHADEQRDVEGMWRAVKGRAAILLSGHDHDMQRFKPVDGTAQYVSGAGGRSHYAVHASDPRLAFSNSSDDGALRIALTEGKAELRFVSTGGDVLDKSTVTCEG